MDDKVKVGDTVYEDDVPGSEEVDDNECVVAMTKFHESKKPKATNI